MNSSRLLRKEIVIVQTAVHAACDFSRFGAESRASTFKEDNDHHPAIAGVCIAGKPAKAGSGVRASTRLAKDFLFIEIRKQAPCCTVFNGTCHTIGHLRNETGDIEMALHDGLKAS